MKNLLDDLRALPIQTKVLFIGGGIGIIILIIFVVNLLGLGKSPSDRKVSEVITKSEPAVIVNSGNLLKDIDSEVAYIQLRKDLTGVARDYCKLSDPIISFEISGDVSQTGAGKDIKFSGHYTSKSRTKIDFTITPLPNKRTKIHAVDGPKELDSYFDANSARNQAIATFPVSTDQYTINYDINSDTFIVSLYDSSDTAKQSANDKLRTVLSLTTLTTEKVTYFYPSNDDTGGLTAPTFAD